MSRLLDVYRRQDAFDQSLAREFSPYQDDELVGNLTSGCVEAGHSIFQIFKLADNDEAHVARLLDYFDPPKKAHVVDLGCGVGEVARLMNVARPDLTFTLVNCSPSQLEKCPERYRESAILGSLDDIPLADESADAVMICYALGHAELDKTLKEASRVLRPGGVLFIYDFTAKQSAKIISSLGYKAHPVWAVRGVASEHGFMEFLNCCLGLGHMQDFLKICDDSDVLEALDDAWPVVYRFVKFHPAFAVAAAALIPAAGAIAI